MTKDHRYPGAVRSELLETELFPALFESCAAFYRVDLTTQQYKTLRQCSALSSDIKEEGDVHDLFRKLVFPYNNGREDSGSYQALLSASTHPGRKCSRRVLHKNGGNLLLVQISCLPVPDQETVYITVMILCDHLNVPLSLGQNTNLDAEGQKPPVIIGISQSRQISEEEYSELDDQKLDDWKLEDWKLVDQKPDDWKLDDWKAADRKADDWKLDDWKADGRKADDLEPNQLKLAEWELKEKNREQTGSQGDNQNTGISEAGQPSRIPHTAGSEKVLDQIEKYIHEHYMEKLTLGMLGKRFYMNSAYLGQLFYKRYKICFNEYLARERLTQAVNLLENTDRLIYEIAAEVGYSTLNYFIKQFTAHYGISPAKYRKRYLVK